MLVTHEMSFARGISDKVEFIDRGRIAESGRTEESFKHTTNARTQQILNKFYTGVH